MIDPKTGQLLETVFSRSEIQRGISLLRTDKVDEEEIDRQGAVLVAAKPEREIVGRLVASADRIREIDAPDGSQAICVIADGHEKNPGHASARSSNAAAPKGELRRLRAKLFRAFGAALEPR